MARILSFFPMGEENNEMKEYLNKTITSINTGSAQTPYAYAFTGQSQLETLIMPSVIRLDWPGELSTINAYSWAFSGCSNLKTVIAPMFTGWDSNTTSNYFTSASSTLEHLEMPKVSGYKWLSMTTFSKLSYIELGIPTANNSNIYSKVPNLRTIKLPSCTTISNYAFQSCSNLFQIMGPINTIGTGAFRYAKNSLQEIFLTVKNLQATSLGFQSCSIQRIQLSLYDSCTSNNIGSGFFSNCASLSAISFHGYNFQPSLGYWNFTSKSIFYGCNNLSEITLNYCSIISNSAFVLNRSHCIKFNHQPFVPDLKESAALGDKSYITYIQIISGMLSSYLAHSVWSHFSSLFSTR